MRIAWAFSIMMLLTPLPSSAAAPVQLLPISGFVPNRGQAPAEALYYAAVPGGALYLTREAIVLDTWETERTSPIVDNQTTGSNQTTRRRGRAVWLRFSGSNPHAIVEGEDRREPYLNFLMGKDPTGWHAEVPVYGRASYRDLWPGIDLTFTSEPNGFACTLNARAGADTDMARFELQAGDGASPANLDVTQLSALLAADIDREVLDSPDDNPEALVWSSFLGGTAEEIGWSTALDSNGNPVVTGLNTSTFFPTTPGAYDQVYSGLGDVFVSKLSADGSALLWSTFLGGTSLQFDYGYAVTVDGSDNPIVTGYTRSEDYPATSGAYDLFYNGEADVFVSKLNAAGSALIWSTFIGGAQHDIGYDLDLDPSGNPVVAGRTLSGEGFPTTPGAYDDTPNGEEDGFIAKLSAAGDLLLWSTFLGGSLYEGVQSVELEVSGGAPIVCGYTASPDFPGGAANGLYDIFVAKISATGASLIWSRLIGGSSYDYGTDLDLDSMGNPVICGSTGSSDFPVTSGAYDETYNGDDDVIAVKLETELGSVLWATFVGGSAPVYEIAHGVVIDSEDRPILAGATPSADFPTTPGAFDTSHNGASDVFVLRLDASGSSLEWSSFFGGPGDDYAFELAKSEEDDVIVTGSVDAGFPVTSGAYDETYNGDISDVFVARIALVPASTNVADGSPAPNPFALTIWPNPFAATTRISFTLPGSATTKIEVFDAQGRLSARIDRGSLGPGAHAIDWNALDHSARPLPSGVYAVRVTAGDWVQSRRVVLLR